MRLVPFQHAEDVAGVDGFLSDGQRRDAVGVYLGSEVSAVIDAHETLCVFCQNSCRRGCSWDDRLEPVRGWTAEETPNGCRVIRCPEFRKETAETILPKEINDDGMTLLLEAMARRMKEDFIRGKGPHDRMSERRKHHHTSDIEIRQANRKEIARWLLRGKGRYLMPLSDPEEVIRQLRKLADKFEERLALGLEKISVGRWDE